MSKLEKIKNAIEKMEVYHQIQILKILKESTTATLNENNNGTFINLTDVDETTIFKLEEYIEYFKHQQTNLKTTEDKKKDIEESFFKDNKNEKI
jgi:hypothetical protein